MTLKIYEQRRRYRRTKVRVRRKRDIKAAYRAKYTVNLKPAYAARVGWFTAAKSAILGALHSLLTDIHEHLTQQSDKKI